MIIKNKNKHNKKMNKYNKKNHNKYVYIKSNNKKLMMVWYILMILIN